MLFTIGHRCPSGLHCNNLCPPMSVAWRVMHTWAKYNKIFTSYALRRHERTHYSTKYEDFIDTYLISSGCCVVEIITIEISKHSPLQCIAWLMSWVTQYPQRTQSPPRDFQNLSPCDWSIWRTNQKTKQLCFAFLSLAGAIILTNHKVMGSKSSGGHFVPRWYKILASKISAS